MKNDYLDYMRATEEYKSSDSLMHYRTKGSKNGVSTTPGYKAIGQKALGILNSAGNYIYNTAQKVGNKVGNALSGVKNDYDLARKKTLSTGKNVITTTKYKGQQVRDDVLPIRKEVDSHEQRRTGYNNANTAKALQDAAERKRVNALNKAEQDRNRIITNGASERKSTSKNDVIAEKENSRYAEAAKKAIDAYRSSVDNSRDDVRKERSAQLKENARTQKLDATRKESDASSVRAEQMARRAENEKAAREKAARDDAETSRRESKMDKVDGESSGKEFNADNYFRYRMKSAKTDEEKANVLKNSLTSDELSKMESRLYSALSSNSGMRDTNSISKMIDSVPENEIKKVWSAMFSAPSKERAIDIYVDELASLAKKYGEMYRRNDKMAKYDNR